MRKLKLFFACMLLTLLSTGQVWADTYTIGWGTASGDNNQNFTATSGSVTDIVSFNSAKNSAQTEPAYNSNNSDLRLYYNSGGDGGSITLTPASGVTITGFVMTTSTAPSVKYKVDGGTATSVSASNNTYTVTGISATSSVEIQNVNTSNTQLRIKTIQITYTPSETPAPTLTSLEISGDLSNKSYETGEVLNYTGLTVTGTYSDSNIGDVTADVEWSFTPALTAGTSSYTVTATIGEISDSKEITGVTVTEHVVTPGTYPISLNNALYGTTENSNITVASVSATQDDITVVTGATQGTKPYTGTTAIRYYTDNYLTLSVPSGYNITAVAFAEPSSSKTWNGSITVNVGTYTADSKSWEGKSNSVTFSFGAQNRIATATVTYESVAPEVMVDPASLSFTAKQNIAVDGKTFTLEGANLTSGLTLAASEGFTVSPTSLTAEAAMAQDGVEVTVTPATPTAATTPVDGTVTISGGGLASNVVVNLSMAVTPTYAVALAVNDNTMGLATINGGAGPVYAEYADEVTLVATANPGYEFVNWTVSTEDIDLGEDAEKANGAVATIGAAGTITATFQAQACTNLDAPTLDEVTKTYQSATIAWNAVDNADGYVLNIKKHEGNVPVVTNELIVAPTVSFERTGLEANTQYDYTVMAVGDGSTYCDESNPLLEGNFTTNDYPSVTVTYSENGNTDNQVSKKIQTAFALPTEVTNEISGKTFVGWTTKSDFEDGNESDEETYFAKGANFTIQSNADVTLYAVYATAGSGAASYVKLTSDAFDANAQYVIGALKSSETHYFYTYSATDTNTWGKMTGDLENNTPIVFTLSGTANALKIKNSSNHYVKAVSGNFQMSTSEFSLKLNSDGTIHADLSGTDVNLRYNSSGDYGLRFYTSTTGSSAYLYKVEQNVSYSDYVISGSAALPVLDAPTGLTAGTYYEAQTITLAATNDAAIYYSLDGNDPTVDAQHLYSEPFTLSERDVVTVKAIAVKSGYENSPVATAEYNINLPYDFADFAALEKVNNKEYAVRGIISQIDELYNNSKLIYHISGNGSTEGQIKCFRGLGLNKETFSSVTDVNLGDNVTVVGTWSTQYSNLNQDNWMLEYTARVAANPAYEIAGELTATSFNVGEAFNPAILANLSVNALFTNGYKEAVVGAEFTYGEKTTWQEGDETLTVTAVKDEEDLVSRDFDVTVTSATLESIALKDDDSEYQTKVVYYVGEEFVAPTIVATLSDETTIEAVATYKEGFDKTTAGVQNVTVKYKRGEITKEVSYDVTVKAVFNNEDDPHTVAIAKELIAPYTTTTSTDYMWVRGIVSQVGSISSGKLKYYISDNGATEGQLYVYDGKYLDNASFTNDNILQVNDEVVIKGQAQNYQGSTLELKNSQVISLAREVEVTVANVAELEVGQADLAVEDLTITTLSEGAVTLSSGNTEIATIDNNKIHAVAAGVVTITANVAANGIYKAASTTFTVTVIAERTRYAVTFDANGGEGTDPVIADQLAGATVELPENPYSKANNAFAGWVVNDGAVEITDGHFTMPAAAVTIKATWNTVATCAISFRVNGEEVATANAPQTAEYSLAGVSHPTVPGFTWEGWSETEAADEVSAKPAIITSITPATGLDEKVLYGIYSRLDDSGANYGKYEKATAVAEGDYLIVCEDQNVAMDGSLTTLDAAGNKQAVTISDGVLTLANADNYVFTIAAVTGGYSIKSKSGYYVSGKGSDSNGMNSSTSTEYVNTITISGGDAVIVGNGAYMRCNPNSNNQWFRYFKSSTYTSQKAIQLYKKNTGATYYTSSPVEKVTVTFDANGGDGGCQKAIINKGGKLTICDDAPTRSQKVFTGWNSAAEGDGTAYTAGTEYTFNADVTLYAQWAVASTYAVTYDVNGSDATAPTQEAQFAGDQFTVAAAIARDGFTFQGWLYNNKLYAAGASFTMPAEAVTFVAQWRKQSQITTYNMSLITDASALTNGMQIALGCSYGENSFAMAGDIASGKSFLSSETENITLSDGVATYTSSVLVMTLEQVENGWKITKDGTNYLYETSVKNLVWATNKETATTWAISFEGNNVLITSENGAIKYNSSDPRFTTYASGQKSIQLFGKAVVVENNTSVSDLGYVEEEVIVVPSNTQFTVDVEITTPVVAKAGATVIVEENAEHLVVEQGGKVEVAEDANTDVFRIQTAPAQQDNSNSGQLVTQTDPNDPTTIKQLTIETLYMDVQLVPSVLQAGYWYSIAAPFDVSLTDGFYLTDGTPLVNNQHIQVWIFNPLQFANGGRAWSRCTDGIMHKNLAHLIGFDPNAFGGEENLPNVIRLKVNNVTIGASTGSLELSQYSGSTGSYNWNGVANPNTHYVSVDRDGQYYDNIAHNFDTYDKDEDNFVVGSPIFCEASSNDDEITISGASSATLAPARVEENRYSFRLRILKQGARFYDNQMIIRASESALPTFEQGKDMVTLNETCNGSAILWTNAYGKRLAIEEAPLQNNQAIYDLSIMTPAAGTYVLRQANEVEGATLYVTYNGAIVWNLSLGDYELDLTRGTTTGYGLLLVAQPNQMPTGLDTTEDVSGDAVQKILLNGQLYILRDGHLFDAVGHEMK